MEYIRQATHEVGLSEVKMRYEDCDNSVGNVQGARLMLLAMESFWRLVSPRKQLSGMEVK
jgi:hypothetical protein